jgi:hypothetical protein
VGFSTYWPLMFGAIVAPLVLMRSDKSVPLGVNIFKQWESGWHAQQPDRLAIGTQLWVVTWMMAGIALCIFIIGPIGTNIARALGQNVQLPLEGLVGWFFLLPAGLAFGAAGIKVAPIIAIFKIASNLNRREVAAAGAVGGSFLGGVAAALILNASFAEAGPYGSACSIFVAATVAPFYLRQIMFVSVFSAAIHTYPLNSGKRGRAAFL